MNQATKNAKTARKSGPEPRLSANGAGGFGGFASPRSNTTFTPNQFFDVCLPHSSRGVVRLVAYMIRRTLGWCDNEGNPQEERIAVSYAELVSRAGISRDMIRSALDEAEKAGFIRCVREGRGKSAGDAGETALYELRWDDSGEYVKDPKRFRGFFEAEGNRTDIPNEFFDRLIPSEPLAVIKAVGAVIRFSIGFQARRGVRRQHVRLSYSDIQRYARVASRATLSAALQTAVARNYITRLDPGFFDPNAGRDSRAAVYALRWADGFGQLAAGAIGQKTEPERNGATFDDRSENRTGDRSEKRTGNGPKSEPEDRSEKRTGIETKQKNETLKQQTGAAADADFSKKVQMLRDRGFDAKTANELAERHDAARIEDQIGWLPLRNPSRNALGMLRRAIEENWPDPAGAGEIEPSRGAVFAAAFYAGLAGTQGAPVAEPSAAEAAAAERYLRNLTDSATEPATGPASETMEAAETGRAFGRMIAQDSPTLARQGITLRLALRIRGDAFRLHRENTLRNRRLRAERTAREVHAARHRPAWIEYLRREEQRVKKERPGDHARFEAHRANERRLLITSPWAVFTEERLARFDTEERRLVDCQKFFAAEVLDFESWDSQLNPEPFEAKSLQAVSHNQSTS